MNNASRPPGDQPRQWIPVTPPEKGSTPGSNERQWIRVTPPEKDSPLSGKRKWIRVTPSPESSASEALSPPASEESLIDVPNLDVAPVVFGPEDHKRHETIRTDDVTVGLATISKQTVREMKPMLPGEIPVDNPSVDPNEDTIRLSSISTPIGLAYLLVIADGMGGKAGGAVASNEAAHAFEASLGGSVSTGGSDIEARARLMQAAMLEANAQLEHKVRSQEELDSADTTLSGVLYSPQTDELALAHVGDCEARLIGADGTLVQLSANHNDPDKPNILLATVATVSRGFQTTAGPTKDFIGIVVASDGLWGDRDSQKVTPEQVSATITSGLEDGVDAGTIALNIAQLNPAGGINDKKWDDTTVGLMLFEKK